MSGCRSEVGFNPCSLLFFQFLYYTLSLPNQRKKACLIARHFHVGRCILIHGLMNDYVFSPMTWQKYGGKIHTLLPN